MKVWEGVELLAVRRALWIHWWHYLLLVIWVATCTEYSCQPGKLTWASVSRTFVEASLRRHDWLNHSHVVELNLQPPLPRDWADITWPRGPIKNHHICTNYHVVSEELTMNNKDTLALRKFQVFRTYLSRVWAKVRLLFGRQIPYYTIFFLSSLSLFVFISFSWYIALDFSIL